MKQLNIAQNGAKFEEAVMIYLMMKLSWLAWSENWTNTFKLALDCLQEMQLTTNSSAPSMCWLALKWDSWICKLKNFYLHNNVYNLFRLIWIFFSFFSLIQSFGFKGCSWQPLPAHPRCADWHNDRIFEFASSRASVCCTMYYVFWSKFFTHVSYWFLLWAKENNHHPAFWLLWENQIRIDSEIS